MAATVLSIQVGMPAAVERPLNANSSESKAWKTGFGKHSVTGPIRLQRLNFDGDAQADLVHHGGLDKAVCVYPASHVSFWRDELDADMSYGAFGENLTVGELTESDVCIGDVWEVGDATLQVSQPRQPCWKLSRWWAIDDLAVRVQKSGRTGWYLRVLAEGTVEAGKTIRVIERPHPQWTIEAANSLMHRDKGNFLAAEQLARIPHLSQSWRNTLMRRSRRRTEPSPNRRLFGG